MGFLCACSLQAQDAPATAPACVTYCTFALQNCSNTPILYFDYDDCAAECALFPTTGQTGDTSGNTLQCRLTYVQVADQAPQAFCDNAGPLGGTNCI